MSNGHARLGPSSASRWVYCPGSVMMEEQFPDDGEEGLEGDASHWAAASFLNGATHEPGEPAHNGVVLNMEMLNGAWTYARAVRSSCHAAPLNIERPLAVHAVHPDCWGTPDCWYYVAHLNELHVWDYKYGWGLVEVAGNWQLTCYAAGALATLPPEVFRSNPTVMFHIVQPRPYHVLGPVRGYRTNALELAPAVQQLQAAAHEALAPNPRVCSGPHCRYCRARYSCTAARNAMYASLDYVERAVVNHLTPEALGVELDILERAEQAIMHLKKGAEAQALSILQNGGTIPGWTREREPGRERWTRPPEQIYALGDLFKKDLRKIEPLTPWQAKQAGMSDAALRGFTERPLADPKLVKSSQSKLAQIFGQQKKGA